jgi:hypothetical protein
VSKGTTDHTDEERMTQMGKKGKNKETGKKRMRDEEIYKKLR